MKDYIGAIEYHKKENNPKQIEFFECELKLINKILLRRKCHVYMDWELQRWYK